MSTNEAKIKEGIAQGLRGTFPLVRTIPVEMQVLLKRIEAAEQFSHDQPSDKNIDGLSDDEVKKRLDAYLKKLGDNLPSKASRALIWLCQPTKKPVRILSSLCLIVGGLLAVLPIFGAWMLPLGFIILSQDVPALQRPLLRAILWTEKTIKRLSKR